MSITISRSIDIENALRGALDGYLTAYCRPLPANYSLPNILITQAGGNSESTASGKGKVDHFIVSIDARAKTEAEALEYLRTAIGILEKTRNGYSHISINSTYSWGNDPVRPDLAMCSATLNVTAHREYVTITEE